MSMEIEFRKVIPITKAYEGDDGELYLEGESSGPELDLDEQFMTEFCVKDMADQVNQSPLRYLDEHQKRGVLSDLGTVIAAEITPEVHLKTKTLLDRDNPAAVALWKKVQQGKKFGQSVAGHVLELARKIKDGKVYQGFNRLRLDHIANTTKPSWAPSLGSLVAKSLEEQNFDWAEAPEYEGDPELPFSAHVEKRSKPDPKAGQGYMLIEEVLRQLNKIFGWESYQERVAEDNRDVIPLQDHPALKPLFPVGSMSPPTKAFDEEDAEWQDFIQKALPVPQKAELAPMPYDFTRLAEIYERLYGIATGLTDMDKASGKKDGKKTVTRLKAAMASIAEAMKQMLAKSAPPQPLVYGEDKVEQPVPSPGPEPTVQKECPMPGALSSFEQMDAVGVVPPIAKAAEPSVGQQPGETLTSFGQVAEAAAETAPAPMPDTIAKAWDDLGEFVTQVFASPASHQEKKAALAQVGKAFFAHLEQQLEAQRPEEMRIQDAVAKAEQRLMGRIETLERQLAAALTTVKSQDGGEAPPEPDEPELVRKSIAVRPSRIVTQQKEAPTFLDLVRGDGGLLN